jgi:glucose-6-phosphate isomerase
MSSFSQNSRSAEWKTLASLAESAARESLDDYFSKDPGRLKRYSIDLPGLYLDFSKNHLTNDIYKALIDLAQTSSLEEKRASMFQGEPINLTEQQAVLHTALRNPDSVVTISGKPVARQVTRQLQRMKICSDRIRSGDWTGCTGKPISDVVNLGIGGSDLGPKMVCEALSEFCQPGLATHFVSNVDGSAISSLLDNLNAQTTLFIISSKTFTTQETLLNARVAVAWLQDKLDIDFPQGTSHFLAVTATPDAAIAYGIDPENILEFWPWVGGRFSLWSAIGVSICISIGHDDFLKLLEGARLMDDHFLSAPLDQNMPVALALVGIWYNNFLDAESIAIVPYCERLGLLPAFLQQLDMESNGKSVTRSGEAVEVTTAPIVWGQAGTNGQHAFFQLLHQGTKLVPVDFIGAVKERTGDPYQHKVLLANMVAQAAALMKGETSDNLHRHYAGNKPSNTLLLDELTPFSLGMLIALYEHKVFVQGVIWDINSFDQWGVELGKRLTNLLLEGGSDDTLDPSTRELMRRSGLKE